MRLKQYAFCNTLYQYGCQIKGQDKLNTKVDNYFLTFHYGLARSTVILKNFSNLSPISLRLEVN